MIKSIVIILIIVAFGLLVMYNKKVLEVMGLSRKRSENIFYRLLGRRIERWNIQVERATTIKSGSFAFKVNNYFKDIIINLGMERDRVTPVGLLTFITSVSLAVSATYVIWSGEYALAIPAFGAIFYFIIVVFRFMSLVAFEKKEGEIMDTEDLLAMDVSGGVYNAILRYRNTLHPNMKPYFEEFIDNMQQKNYGFKSSMLILNNQLGKSFTNFAQKAILYEDKADKDMSDIFSSVVEINRYKRTLRYENNKKFNQLRLEFILSISVIGLYGVFSIFSDPFLANFFKNTFFGKVLLIGDLVLVTAVLAYISSIKSKFL